MIENVPPLAGDHRMVALGDILTAWGYVCSMSVLDAADYGVPQRRRRMIFTASRDAPVPFARRSKRRRTVRDAIWGLPKPGQSGDELHDVEEKRSERVKKMIASIPKNGGSRAALEASLQLACHKRTNGFKDVYGRMAWDDVAPTITAGCTSPSKGRFLHPVEDRAITLREAALLQSFPPTYRFSLRRGKMAAAAQIGNAIPPELIRRQAVVIRKHLERRG